MSDNIAMGREGTQYCRDGVELSWPFGGVREVIALPAAERTQDVSRRIVEGSIVEVDLPVNRTKPSEDVPTILTGEAARARLAEPAGPVYRQQYVDGSVEMVPMPEHAVAREAPESTKVTKPKARKARIGG